VSFVTITLFVVSQRVFIVSVYFVMTQSGNFWKHPHTSPSTNEASELLVTVCRYGQEDEDRQWDSGGYYYGTRDHYENRVNSRRSANRKVDGYAATGKASSQEEGEDEYYSPQGGLSYEEDFTGNEYPSSTVIAVNSTPTTTRRRAPQRRSSSRQSSTEDYDYIPTGSGGYYDDYSRRHTGGTGTVPSTTTTTTTTSAAYSSSASTGRTNHLPKPPSSVHKHQLPPTPVRQLPHHSATDAMTTTTNATTRRSGTLLSRTSSAECADHDSYPGSYSTYYNTSRGVGKDSGYNEDYNYAYRSIDNLATTQQDSVDDDREVILHDKRTNDGRLSATGTRGYQQATPTAQRRNNSTHQRQHSEEYYYNVHEENEEEEEEEDMGYYNDTAVTRNDSRKKILTSRGDNSPLLQQNTDSLESRDDELRDSFETAVSSVTSLAQHHRGVQDYSTATETPADMTPVSVPTMTTATSAPVSTANHAPPQTAQHRSSAVLSSRDQEPSSKAAANTAPAVIPAVSSATSVTTTTTSTTAASTTTSTINSTVLPPHSAYHSQTSVHRRGCLRTQDSLDSCDEEVSLHSAGVAYYTKSMNFRDSPPSVLLERYGTDTPTLRVLNSLIEPYQPQPNKAASIHASPSPPTMVQKQQSRLCG